MEDVRVDDILLMTNEEGHQCPKCSRIFKRLGHFKCHFYQVHQDSRLSDFLSVPEIKPQQPSARKKPKPTKCPKEEASVKKLKSVKKNRFKCKVCFKEFTTKNFLVRHTAKEHSNDNELSSESSELTLLEVQHYKVKESSQPSAASERTDQASCLNEEAGSYKCEECYVVFSLKSALIEHKKTHKTVKNFSCETCSSRFATKQVLNIHLCTHVDNDSPICPICEKKFARKCHLVRHVICHS